MTKAGIIAIKVLTLTKVSLIRVKTVLQVGYPLTLLMVGNRITLLQSLLFLYMHLN